MIIVSQENSLFIARHIILGGNSIIFGSKKTIVRPRNEMKNWQEGHKYCAEDNAAIFT
jgi:hypothetical protein